MSKHPPGLDGGKYRCCCHHVNEGALIVGVLGLMLTWYNPISIIAHIFLIIGYLAQNRRFHYLYIVLGWISCALLIVTGIATIVFRTKAGRGFYRFLPPAVQANEDADTYLAISVIVLAVSLALQIWFINIVERAREYLQKKKEHKRANYVVSAPNVFAASSSAGPAYSPSAPTATTTDNATPYPAAPPAAQSNLYPAIDVAA